VHPTARNVENILIALAEIGGGYEFHAIDSLVFL
jgi:hypothetical protein